MTESGRRWSCSIERFSILAVELGRIVRFGIVGIAATLVYLGIATIAALLFDVRPVPASIIGQCASAIISYYGHTLYSFRVELDHRRFLARFLVIAVVTFAMNVSLTWLLADVLGLPYLVTILMIAVLIPVTGYFCNRFWVFLPGVAISSPVAASVDELPYTSSLAKRPGNDRQR